eukprot:GHVP01035742.1.p1 GENE.GHVP01035742.1~~GHVP01035742.1.p1  ORF type:complete len:406 (+),score=53.44 GHVP01035742.1:724-1941(+)
MGTAWKVKAHCTIFYGFLAAHAKISSILCWSNLSSGIKFLRRSRRVNKPEDPNSVFLQNHLQQTCGTANSHQRNTFNACMPKVKKSRPGTSRPNPTASQPRNYGKSCRSASHQPLPAPFSASQDQSSTTFKNTLIEKFDSTTAFDCHIEGPRGKRLLLITFKDGENELCKISVGENNIQIPKKGLNLDKIEIEANSKVYQYNCNEARNLSERTQSKEVRDLLKSLLFVHREETNINNSYWVDNLENNEHLVITWGQKSKNRICDDDEECKSHLLPGKVAFVYPEKFNEILSNSVKNVNPPYDSVEPLEEPLQIGKFKKHTYKVKIRNSGQQYEISVFTFVEATSRPPFFYGRNYDCPNNFYKVGSSIELFGKLNKMAMPVTDFFIEDDDFSEPDSDASDRLLQRR